MTAGELRRALEGVDDAMEVFVHASERLFASTEMVTLVQPVQDAARERDLNDTTHFIIRAFELPPATPIRTLRLVKS